MKITRRIFISYWYLFFEKKNDSPDQYGHFFQNRAFRRPVPEMNTGLIGKSDRPRISIEKGENFTIYAAQSSKNGASSGKRSIASVRR